MKKFVFIIIAVLCCISCQSQGSSKVPQMEYGDCEPEIVPVGLIFENVLDFIYDPNEDLFLIEYSDEVISQTNDDEWNTLDYIQIECSKKDFFDVLEEYSVWTENHNQRDLNWGFIEIVSPVEGGLNYRYSLVNLNLADF